jgi:hypothetical protein
MRKPSRASVILLVTTPIIGCILLWYVLFPGVDNEGIQDLSSAGSNYYGEDGYMAGDDSESNGGSEEIKSQPRIGYTNTQGNSGGSINGKTYARNENTSGYKVNYNETPNTSVNNEIPVINNRSNTNSSGNNNHNNNEDTRGENIKTGAAQIAAIATAAEQIKRAADQIKVIKKDKDDQSKIGSGSNGLLLLPPDEDDPMDVPLDGGITILVTAALGYGIRKTGMLKRRREDKNK